MENPNAEVVKNNLNASKDSRSFRYANYVLIFVMVFICFAAFSGFAYASHEEDMTNCSGCDKGEFNGHLTETLSPETHSKITKDKSYLNANNLIIYMGGDR